MTHARCIVIRDEHEMDGLCNVVARVLRSQRYDVASFSSGDEALAHALAHAGPSVLFFGALRIFVEMRPKLERGALLGTVRVVLATGAPPESVPRLPHMILLRKPFDVGDLLAAIASVA